MIGSFLFFGGMQLEIDTGCFYFVKDCFFDFVGDEELMKNKENGNKRPCYYCLKSKEDAEIMWFIPISTKVDKYIKVYNNKMMRQIEKKRKIFVDTIAFGYIANNYNAFLTQNMFPVTNKFIEKQYIKNKVKIRISHELQVEIREKAIKVLKLYKHGMKNIIFPDIDSILKKLTNINNDKDVSKFYLCL